MSNNDELPGVSNDTVMTAMRHKAISQWEVFSQARDQYQETMTKLKAKMKDVPLKYLEELAIETGKVTRSDPDFIPESRVSVAEAARREIHRRAFQEFTIVPTNKTTMNSFHLGFLRKPKF